MIRALDLFCKAGGMSRGLQLAGFHVTGVDISPQPNYIGDLFIQADVTKLTPEWIKLGGYDLVCASPPCQAHTSVSNRWRHREESLSNARPDLIGLTRGLLAASHTPFCIENVTGARSKLFAPILLHGGMFDLRVYRPRLFETYPLLGLPIKYSRPIDNIGIYGSSGPNGRWLWKRKNGTRQITAKSLQEARLAMGIDWMTWDELREAIPPAYGQYIGLAMRSRLGI